MLLIVTSRDFKANVIVVSVCTCARACGYMYVCACAHNILCIYICVRVSMCMFVCLYVCVCVCLSVYMRVILHELCQTEIPET